MECAIRTIRKINFNMGAIKVEDTKRIRFSNMAKFMFNEDQAIIFNRLNGQWIKVPKQCYDILELCNKEGLSWSVYVGSRIYRPTTTIKFSYFS